MVLLHPDRYSTLGVLSPKNWIIIHDSESGDETHDTLIRLLQAPGDRDNGHGGRYGSGYHAVTNGFGGYTEVADKYCGPYSAPPVNKTAWHICMPGRANQSRAMWLDPVSYNHIRGVAAFIAAKCNEDGIPRTRLIPADMKLGIKGYGSHHDVSIAWNKTNHTDPGPNFPWDILAIEIDKIYNAPKPPVPLPPVGEEDMTPYLVRPDNDAAVFILTGNNMTWAVSQEIIDSRKADNTLATADPKVINPATLKSYVLVGQEPDYSGGDGGLPGRTKATAFAAWIK